MSVAGTAAAPGSGERGIDLGPTGAEGRLAPRAWALVGLLALLVGLPSLGNGFAYDDVFIIVNDGRVHDLSQWRGWWTLPYWTDPPHGVYRPLMTTLFALEWAIADGAAWVFHAVNVVLHTLVAVSVLWAGSLLLTPSVAVAIGSLFAVHPVHVEAIANVVGQAELIVGLCLVLGLGSYVHWARAGGFTPRRVVALSALFAVGVLTKEHAFVLPGLWLIAECTVLRDVPGIRIRLRARWMLYAVCAAIAGAALWARWLVLGAIDASSVHGALTGLGAGGRAMVMLGIVPEVVRLMVWPRHLHADYSPMHVVVSAEPALSQLPGVAAVAVYLAGMLWAWWQRPTLALAGAVFLLPWLPTANLLFPSGVLLAERALYTPSAGFLLGLGVVVGPWCAGQGGVPRRRWLVAAAVALTMLGLLRSATRAPVWASNERLFAAMVEEQPLSAKAHLLWGGVLEERGDLDGALREWRMAIRIDPASSYYQSAVGQLLARGERCDVALPYLREAVRLGGPMLVTRGVLVRCLVATGDVTAARGALAELASRGVDAAVLLELAALVDGASAAATAGASPAAQGTR